MVPKIREGSKLFVLTSQQHKISFKLAQKWMGPCICIKILENNNLLLKPINGRKIISVHRNLCKLVPDRMEHLRFNDDNPFDALTPFNYDQHNDPIEPKSSPNVDIDDDHFPPQQEQLFAPPAPPAYPDVPEFQDPTPPEPAC